MRKPGHSDLKWSVACYTTSKQQRVRIETRCCQIQHLLLWCLRTSQRSVSPQLLLLDCWPLLDSKDFTLMAYSILTKSHCLPTALKLSLLSNCKSECSNEGRPGPSEMALVSCITSSIHSLGFSKLLFKVLIPLPLRTATFLEQFKNKYSIR